MKRPARWAVRWHSENRQDGVSKYYLWDYALPLLFLTRREARAYIESKYGYIKSRPDLKAEPHGWRLPQAVKVQVIFKEVGR